MCLKIAIYCVDLKRKYQMLGTSIYIHEKKPMDHHESRIFFSCVGYRLWNNTKFYSTDSIVVAKGYIKSCRSQNFGMQFQRDENNSRDAIVLCVYVRTHSCMCIYAPNISDLLETIVGNTPIEQCFSTF